MPFSPKLFLELHMLGFDSVLRSGRQASRTSRRVTNQRRIRLFLDSNERRRRIRNDLGTGQFDEPTALVNEFVGIQRAVKPPSD
jgi:hypothetical protein